MHLAEFQALIRDRYHATDNARGVPGTFLWLTEEIGELASELALRERGEGNPEALASEFADVLAWLATIANVCEIDLEAAIHAKYIAKGGPEGTK
jgi:NTP pyrophosphatase (non-canonical NTP hydrolase)